MALLTKSEYGSVNIGKQVLSKLILDEILKYSDIIYPCSCNGKQLKRGFFSGINDMLPSVDVQETDEGIKVVFHIIVKFGESINDVANAVFDNIERDFAILALDKPTEIKASIKGVMSDRLVKRDIELVRTNG